MPDAEIAAIISRLKAISKRVEQDELRFRDCPLFALWVSTEGPAPNWDTNHIDEAEASRYLMIPRENLVAIGSSEYRNPTDPFLWWPLYAYFKPGLVEDETKVAQEIRKQVAAMMSVSVSLEQEVMTLPLRIRELYRLPKDVRYGFTSFNWLKILFHLAIHYSPAFRPVTRQRWVYILDEATLDGEGDTLQSNRNTDKIHEFHLQIEDAIAPCEDIWPGTIWCKLSEDIFTSTKQAIDLLIQMVEQADVVQPPPDASTFAELLKKFEALAAEEEKVKTQSAVQNKNEDDDGEEYSARYEPLLLRIGSPFTTPAVRDWCDSISPFAEKFIELSRWHNFVELVTFRHMPPEFERLCEEAGALLAREYGVVPLMSSRRSGGGDAQGASDFAVPSANPAARWIRFVFDKLRRLKQRSVSQHFQPLTINQQFASWAPYGYVTLNRGFYRSSVMAITHIELPSETIDVDEGYNVPVADNFRVWSELVEAEKAKIQLLEPAILRAYLEFIEAEYVIRVEAKDKNQTVTARDAYEWLMKDEHCAPPNVKYATWERYVTDARRSLGKSVYKRRKSKATKES